MIEVVFHYVVIFVTFVLFFADEDRKAFLRTSPTTWLCRDSTVYDSAILPTQNLSFFEMFIIYQYGVHLPSASCSLQVNVLYSNAHHDSVLVREGGRNNFYSHFFAVLPRLCRNGLVSWLHGRSSMCL